MHYDCMKIKKSIIKPQNRTTMCNYENHKSNNVVNVANDDFLNDVIKI